MDFRKFYTVFVCALLATGSVFGATVSTAWVQIHNGTYNGYDSAADIATDSAGNIYVTGYAKNTDTGYDIVTIKYDPNSSIGWTKIYNRLSNNSEYAVSIAIDSNSNVIVAGYGYSSASGYDGLVVKYDSAGTQLWEKSYASAGTSNDRFHDVVVDSAGNIYAVGKKADDTLAVKYTPSGTLAWAKTYNGPGNGNDVFYNAAVDSNGNLYACGEATGLTTGQDCLTVKYSPDGTQAWLKTLTGPETGWDLLQDIAIDTSDNLYVTGSIEDANGSDYVTIKYSSAGNNLWISSYDGPYNGWDDGHAVAVTSDGHVAVTGYSKSSTRSEAATIKYNSSTGIQMWAAIYDSASNDYAQDIAADSAGNIYIAGICYNSSTDDYLTACYNSAGSEKWVASFNGSGSNTDAAGAVAVFGSNVYVTGKSINTAGNYDYATLKYTAAECTTPPVGDLNGDCVVNFFDFEVFADGFADTVPEKLILKNIADTWLDCGFADPNDCF